MHKKFMRRVIFLLAAVLMITCGSVVYAGTIESSGTCGDATGTSNFEVIECDEEEGVDDWEVVELLVGESYSGRSNEFYLVVNEPGMVSMKFYFEFEDKTYSHYMDFRWATSPINEPSFSHFMSKPVFEEYLKNYTYETKTFLEKGRYYFSYTSKEGALRYSTFETSFKPIKTSFSDVQGEEDNTPNSANDIKLTERYYGIIGEYDTDVYKFTLDENCKIDINVGTHTNADLSYSIYDSNIEYVVGESLDCAYYDTAKYFSWTNTHSLEKGTYYLAIRPQHIFVTADYEFQLTDGNHLWDNGTVTKAATCTKNGTIKYKCKHTWCNEEKIDVIPAKGHKETTLAGKAATCTQSGKTAGKKCTVCKTITVKQKTIDQLAHNYKSVITKATTSKNGKIVKKCDCGKVKSTTTIKKASKISLSKTEYTYNGKVLKAPTITVKDSAGKTIAKSNYTISKPSKSLKTVGKYTYTIKFKGNYSGTKKLTVTIKPKAPTLKSVTAAKKGFTVKWSKVSKEATGYEIMYATNSKFTKGKKTVKATSYKTISKKVTKLKAKTKYYVKVRTYKTVNGVKYYSSWSKTKSVTTKK